MNLSASATTDLIRAWLEASPSHGATAGSMWHAVGNLQKNPAPMWTIACVITRPWHLVAATVT